MKIKPNKPDESLDESKEKSEKLEESKETEEKRGLWDRVKIVFGPTSGGFNHYRLLRQGAIFALSGILMLTGLVSSFTRHKINDYKASQTDTFQAGTELAFSKTGTTVTHYEPFMLKNRKTVYIPLKVDSSALINGSGIENDFSKYHVIVAPTSGNLSYKLRTVRIIGYGSTGDMILECKSKDAIKSQLLRFYVYYTTKYSNSDDSTSSDNLPAFAKYITGHYDSFTFTINLGGSSIKTVPNSSDDSNLYGASKYVPLGIYNVVHAKNHMANFQEQIKKDKSKLQILINQTNKNYTTLTKQLGFTVKSIPTWAQTTNNDLSVKLPVDYTSLTTGKLISKTWVTGDWKNAQDALSKAMMTSAKFDESDYIAKLNSSSIVNSTTGKLAIGDNANVSDSKASKEDANGTSTFSAYIDNLKQIYKLKKSMYYNQPIKLYQYYQTTLADCGLSDNQQSQMGYSQTAGKDKAAKYMIISDKAI